MGRKTQRFYFFSLSSSGGCCVTGRTRGPSSGRGVVARNNSFGTDSNGRVGSRYYVAICHIIQRLLRNQHDDDSKSVDNLFLFNLKVQVPPAGLVPIKRLNHITWQTANGLLPYKSRGFGPFTNEFHSYTNWNVAKNSINIKQQMTSNGCEKKRNSAAFVRRNNERM